MVSRLGWGEVKHSVGESRKPASEWGSFQTQQTPGAKNWWRAVADTCFPFYSGLQRGCDSTKPGDTLKVRPVLSAAKLDYVHQKASLLMHQKIPPHSNFSDRATQRSKPLWTNTDHVRKIQTRSRWSHRNIKTNSSGLATSLRASFIRGQSRGEEREGRENAPQVQLK